MINFDCKTCNGEGETYHYFVDHKHKVLKFEWAYCTSCYPSSECFFSIWYDEIDSIEFEKLKKEGYKELD